MKCPRCNRETRTLHRPFSFAPTTQPVCSHCFGEQLTEEQMQAYLPPETWPLDESRRLNEQLRALDPPEEEEEDDDE